MFDTLTRLTHDTVQVGDIVGIEFAANASLKEGSGTYIKALGEYEVAEDKRCLYLKPIKDNWFQKIYNYNTLRDFGPDMFILLRREK